MKLEAWQAISARIDKVCDTLTKPIEPGIKEIVIALNALNFTTIGSCEGHTDWSERAPWISFEVRGTEKNRARASRAFTRARNSEKKRASQEDLWKLYTKAHALQAEASKPLRKKAQELAEYLDHFYADRLTPFDVRLILIEHATSMRLINQGYIFQQIRTENERASKLVEYQEEIRSFGNFLKNVYFAS